MDVNVPFTSTYTDLSTDKGHQFEFFCERCGNGYRSSFKASTVTNVGSAATQKMGGMFGGKLSKIAAQADQTLHNVADSKTREHAFTTAVDEVRPQFHRCNQCRAWVCEEKCWDDEYNLCTTCAAEQRQQGVEASSAAATQAQEQAGQVAQKMAQAIGGAVAQARQASTCPSCGATTAGAKFCPQCGQAMSVTVKCGSCGKEAPAGTKFCPECGAAVGAG